MKMLLPYPFKKAGVIMIPLGLILWTFMQKKIIYSADMPIIHITAAVSGVFLFVIGIICICFSREKIEDEMIKTIRLESFQIAGMIQLILLFAGLIYILVAGDPGESGMMLFLLQLTGSFWIIYVLRFNYIIHWKNKDIKE